jgi:pilus assembly protein TadC
MKKIFQIIAPVFFIVIVTNSFTKNMEYPLTQFLISVLGLITIYNFLSLIKRENFFIYAIGISIIVFLTICYIKSVFFIGIFSGIIITLFWFLTKKYLNNFKYFKKLN